MGAVSLLGDASFDSLLIGGCFDGGFGGAVSGDEDDGEARASGVLTNTIPKEGGNSYRGSFLGNFANNSFQSNNLTDELKARGLTRVNSVFTVADNYQPRASTFTWTGSERLAIDGDWYEVRITR